MLSPLLCRIAWRGIKTSFQLNDPRKEAVDLVLNVNGSLYAQSTNENLEREAASELRHEHN